jgi:hypothetical protein
MEKEHVDRRESTPLTYTLAAAEGAELALDAVWRAATTGQRVNG